MGRKETLGSIGGRSMQAIEHPALQLLLQERASQSLRDTADAPCGRDLYSTSVSGLAQNCSGDKKRRLRCQSQAHPENHATVRTGWQPAWSQHLQASTRTHQGSLFAGQCGVDGTAGGMEHRHHVYPAAKWACVSRCHYRLVQPLCAVVSPLQQLGNELLPGCSRRCARKARKAQNLQYRSRSAI